MTIGGLVAAVVLGAVIGALGRLLVPGRPGMPGWLLMAAGVVAAFAGTGLAQVFGLAGGGWSPWETVLQIVLAAAGVCLVAAFWPKRTGGRP
ncbi:transglycosylase [Actinomadura latina]|uniref:GlsB/YeaQ/YmgE family stress response membrane protein n=1 Tax=Actinomadura latina TaxID=163603 RepID=A0A846YWI3_9ACTN|nr:transglycosylase [Actinomadura latina]NKZ04077.1 GlsB/YeaQ/YmgE family stress response membrane protein [Actinomadura latina]